MKVLLFLQLFFFISGAFGGLKYYPITEDIHPCRPHLLKKAFTYICNSDGSIQCLHGWMEENPPDNIHPCQKPICSSGCFNGDCRGPDICACEIGWEGRSCNNCITLPGCRHGRCDGMNTSNPLPLGCICDDGWSGRFCDIPQCDNCTNGVCTSPGVCTCHSGWQGHSCDECVDLVGCQMGSCDANATNPIPNGCICQSGYTGTFCDELDCSQVGNPGDNCVQGECQIVIQTGLNVTACVCNVGWQGDNCDMCVPYPGCPTNGTCTQPNECMCSGSDEFPCGVQI